MPTKRFLPFFVVLILVLLPQFSGSAVEQEPQASLARPLRSTGPALPEELGAADWEQIRALLPFPSQQAYLKASNTGAGDQFGTSVAFSGDTVVVGANLEDSAATGVNGSQNDNSAENSGAAYVFVRAGSTWKQQAYLKASNTEERDYFGCSVAISGDTVVVGAREEDSNATGVNGDQNNNSALNSGAAYVFVRAGNTWSQQAYLKASNTGAPILGHNDSFGASVAISGNTIIVTAPEEDSATTGVNGNQNDDSATDAGAAYVFVRAGNTWSQQAYLKASNTEKSDNFGFSAAISGATVVVTATGEDSAAKGVNGNQHDNSAGVSGAAYVFVRAGNAWSQQAYLKASNTDVGDTFGDSVAISGNTLVVGATGEDSYAKGVNGNQKDNSEDLAGAAYVFVRSGSAWKQQAYLKASNTFIWDYFGFSVAVSGNTVAVGAKWEDSMSTGLNGNQSRTDGFANTGAVYVFARTGSTWKQQAYVKASNTGDGDLFGSAVALSEGTLVVAAPFEDSNATSVNGNQYNNSAENAGAAYIFSPKSLSMRSQAAQDGWILESGEKSNQGGAPNAGTDMLRMGDDAKKKQFLSILSFTTKGLPDKAVITSLTLKVKKQGVSGGGDPVNLFKGFMVDVKKGFFGPSVPLQTGDFQAPADKSYGPFKPSLTSGWYTFNLTPAKAYINNLNTNGGVTQLRLRFKLDDNNNKVANYLSLYSGNAPAASRPQLIIEYYVP